VSAPAIAEPAQNAPSEPPPAPPANRCLLHPPPREGRSWRLADPGYVTCSGCLAGFRGRLGELLERWVLLSARPGASGEPGGRGAPGYGSRPPASLHVIALTDWRSSRVARAWIGSDRRVYRESLRPPLSVPGELHALCHHVADARALSADVPTDVPAMVRWLDQHLDWITRQPGVVECDRIVRRLVGLLRPPTGEPTAKRVGRCPNTITLADGEHTRECQAPLFAPLRGDEIHCRECGRRWEAVEWLRLGQMLDGPA
jgi:hypothetical protein